MLNWLFSTSTFLLTHCWGGEWDCVMTALQDFHSFSMMGENRKRRLFGPQMTYVLWQTADFRGRDTTTQLLANPIKIHKTASLTGISNTRCTRTLHKSCWRDPGEMSTWVLCYFGWPADPKLSKNNYQRQTASRKLHKWRSTAEKKTMSAVPDWNFEMDRCILSINWWTGIFLWHWNATTKKAAPMSSRRVWKGRTCGHLQPLHTSF